VKLAELSLDSELLWLVTMGPGFGESIVVAIPGHVGLDWIVVDSLRCQDSKGDFNPALALLMSNNARLAAIALTHPHRDHVRGMVQLLDLRSPGTPVGCLPAYLKADPAWQPTDDAGEVLDRGASAAAFNRIDEIWRNEPKSRWELVAGETQQVGAATLEVLHPAVIPDRRPRDLNRLSSPILVEWKECRVLLGADLPNTGWKKVSTSHPRAATLSRSAALKASHHGSGTAQHRVAIGAPPPSDRFCVVTPFNRGKPLPDYGDGQGIDLILRSHTQVCVTAVPAEARGVETPRARLAARHGSFGEFQLAYELPPAVPQEAWVAVGLDGSGAEVKRLQGAAAGSVA
jgi:hypothetical protein